MLKQSKWIIEFYEKSNGRVPTQKFLDSLTNQDFVHIERVFDRLREFGHKLERPYFDYLRDDIYEIRVKTENKQLRFLCFFYGHQLIIVTHGFVKKADKVPDFQIDKAVEYRKDYLKKHVEE